MTKLTTYEVITNELVKAMEKAQGTFELPWNHVSGGMPVNGSTGRVYSGVNVLVLWSAAFSNGFTSNEWMTYKQAQGMGGQVRKGSKGTQVVFWAFRKKVEEVVVQENGKDVIRKRETTIPLCRTYTVFNRDQIEGLPEVEVPVVIEKTRKENIDQFIKATGAKITFGGNKACYRPKTDDLLMPEFDQFKHVNGYYSTVFHELGHWTGAATRLNRDMTGRFGSESYAMEELVAELTSAFLCAEFNLTNELQHAEYLANWIRVLKSDSYAIFTASREATKAAKFLKGEVDTEDEQEDLGVDANA